MIATSFVLAAHTNVVWLGPRLEPRISARDVLRDGCDPSDFSLRANLRETFEMLDDDLKEYVATQTRDESRLSYVSHVETIEFDEARDVGNCDYLYWSDTNHWSPRGEAYFGAKLRPVLMSE